MRYFNTHGPVNAQQHYVVARQALVDQWAAQIAQGKYFTIYAPRQMGKTTLLYSLEEVLAALPDFLPISLTFELYEHWSEERFLAHFGGRICDQIQKALPALNLPNLAMTQTLLATPPTDYEHFVAFFTSLRQLAPVLKVVLIIDEFDATPPSALSPLLQTWRSMYLDRHLIHSLHSVVLLGIQNIAQLNVGRSSPFNIAYQRRLEPFTLQEVRELLEQYTTETGQLFALGIIEKIHQQTNGQPFLVNRLAAILTEEVVQDRQRVLAEEDLQQALTRLLRESNYNFETILRHATAFQEDVLRIIFGADYKFTLNNPLVKELHYVGVLQETSAGLCQIANPIYKQILIDYFTPPQIGLQAAILANGYDFRSHVVGQELQIKAILSRFREFVERRGREAFKVTPMPQEATGQYLLMAYLELVVRQVGGDLFTEVSSGEGRMDVIVIHQGRRYIIETKVWRGPVEFERGLAQLRTYMQSEGQPVGYYVLFHARPDVYGKLSHEQLEFTEQVAGAPIHVYLIRLGEVITLIN